MAHGPDARRRQVEELDGSGWRLRISHCTEQRPKGREVEALHGAEDILIHGEGRGARRGWASAVSNAVAGALSRKPSCRQSHTLD